MRKAAKVAGMALTGALVGAGCGGVEESGGESPTPPSATALSTTERSSELDGSWLTGSGTDQYLLSILDGEGVALVGAVYCTGTVERRENYLLRLDCPDGSDDRTAGTLTLRPNGSSLTVRWNGAGQEVFHRVDEPADLPEDFPTPAGDPANPPARPAST